MAVTVNERNEWNRLELNKKIYIRMDPTDDEFDVMPHVISKLRLWMNMHRELTHMMSFLVTIAIFVVQQHFNGFDKFLGNRMQ